MTLVAALSGCDGTILFADTEEVVSEYSTRTVDKLAVWDCSGFRLGIAGATTDGTYADMLQSEILGSLSRIGDFDMQSVKSVLSGTLTEFYSKHIWPRMGEKPQMQYLLVIQPTKGGSSEIVHISETAVNFISNEYRSIGIGSYLADYIFKKIFQNPTPYSGVESLSLLCGAGIYAAKEVRENIDGVGTVDRVAVFTRDGQYDELYPIDISKIEENLASIQEFLGYFYKDVLDVERQLDERLSSEDFIPEIRGTQSEWYGEWKRRSDTRKRLRERANEQASGG